MNKNIKKIGKIVLNYFRIVLESEHANSMVAIIPLYKVKITLGTKSCSPQTSQLLTDAGLMSGPIVNM
jgi:hypothetical protein